MSALLTRSLFSCFCLLPPILGLALLLTEPGLSLVVGQDKKDLYYPPNGYLCYRATMPLTVDGKIDEEAWKAAPWTEDFVDIEGNIRPKPRFRTRVKMLWDDRAFYIAADMEEPHVWGTLTRHDSVIFHDNDFEVFIDPDGDNHEYGELELNALNTTWDLLLTKPYRDRGKALNEWEIKGLRTAVHIDGTLNNHKDTDRGWSVEIAIPWESLGKLILPESRSGLATPPREGDQWRVNFSRVEWMHEIVDGTYRKVKGRKEDNWVWSPQGAIDMHRPEKWGYVQFTRAEPGKATFRPDPAGPARHLLSRIYAAQGAFRSKAERYATKLEDLAISNFHHESLVGPPTLEGDDMRFQATVQVRTADGAVQRWRIHEDSRIRRVE